MIKLFSFDFNFWFPISLISPEQSRQIIKKASLEWITIHRVAPLQILISRLIPAQQHLMKTAEPEYEKGKDDAKGQNDHRDDLRRRVGFGGALLVRGFDVTLAFHYMQSSEDCSLYQEYTNHAYKADEVFVVPFADACSEPRTVVVQSLDATAADSTVDGPWRSVDVARCTVFHLCQERSVHGEVLSSVEAVLGSIIQIVLICSHQEVPHRNSCRILRRRQHEKHRGHEAKQQAKIEPRRVRWDCVLQVTKCIETQEQLYRVDDEESAKWLPKIDAKLDSPVGEVQLFALPILIFQFGLVNWLFNALLFCLISRPMFILGSLLLNIRVLSSLNIKIRLSVIIVPKVNISPTRATIVAYDDVLAYCCTPLLIHSVLGRHAQRMLVRLSFRPFSLTCLGRQRVLGHSVSGRTHLLYVLIIDDLNVIIRIRLSLV